MMRAKEVGAMPPLLIRTFHSKRKMQEALAKEGLFPSLDSDFLTFSVETDSGMASFVLIGRKDRSPETLGVIAHEAVHVAQAYFDGISEDSPADEEMAYVTQAAATEILRWHLGKERRCT
jgi:hypothetical protein